jgi:hypothetical protein
MNWTKSKYITLYMVGISLAVVLAIDFLVGDYLVPCDHRHHLTFSRCHNLRPLDPDPARISSPIYHHDLAKNYKGTASWGNLTPYSICTDANGFKVACSKGDTIYKHFDIAFIGDSFTEGIGLNYEDTFVGQISAQLPSLKIANLGVASYSPSIYFSKVAFLLENGVKFSELVVYIDISDIQDEAIYYRLVDNSVVPRNTDSADNSFFRRVRDLAQWSFPVTYQGLRNLKNLLGAGGTGIYAIHDANYSRSAWTYNSTGPWRYGDYGEGGVKEGVANSLFAMKKLSDLLEDRGIALSVGVYPWPGQLLYDTKESQHVLIWREFCASRCKNFYNSFDSFFALQKNIPTAQVINEFFIKGDVHHNRKGAEVIANDFLRIYQK